MFDIKGKGAKNLFIILSNPKILNGISTFLSTLTVSNCAPCRKLEISDGVSKVELILDIFNLKISAIFNKGIHKGE